MSGLPFFDVLLLDYIPKSAGLPVATVQQTKERIASGRWDFDYVFFTESDQVPNTIFDILPLETDNEYLTDTIDAISIRVVLSFRCISKTSDDST